MSFRLLFCLSALLFAGCTTSTDVSSDESVRDYMGKTVVLHRPMLLINHSDNFFGGRNDVISARHVRYGLTEPDKYDAPHIFAKLPPGHRVTIDAVREEVCVDSYITAVYGRTTFPPTGKEVSFAYTGPPMTYLSSEWLPWEARPAGH